MYHFIRIERIKSKVYGRMINIPASYWRRFGGDYRSHLQDLIDRKWIDENPRYKNAQNGFCKSYRISAFFWEGKPSAFKRHAVAVSSKTFKKFGGKYASDRSDISTPYLKLIKARHDTISINKANTTEERYFMSLIDNKVANISRKNESRVYHTVVINNSDYRKYLNYGDRGKLVNVDVSGMVQQLLNREIKDETWNKWIKEDFSNSLKEAMKLKGRRYQIKRTFMTAVSKIRNKKLNIKVAKEIKLYLLEKFPKIMEYIGELNKISTIQGETQKMESKVIENFIMQNQHLSMIPAHDGVFCGHLDALGVQKALEDFLESEGMIPKTKIVAYDNKTKLFIERMKANTVLAA